MTGNSPETAFFGFTVGAILYGITVLQAYQYYTNAKHSGHDSIYHKLAIGNICLLDTLHLAFATYMVYSFLILSSGDNPASKGAIWSFKAMGAVQVVFIIFVHWLYLHRIWKLSNGVLALTKWTRWVHSGVLITGFISLVVGTALTYELQSVKNIIEFPPRYQRMIYVGFGATVFIDCGIAAAMCLILYRNRVSIERTDGVVQTLIQYVIATGLLTSLSSLLCLVLYAARPNNNFYLVVEFSITRLHTNSTLAMYNARHRLRERLDEDVQIGSIENGIMFNEPDLMPSNISILSERMPSTVTYQKHDNISHVCCNHKKCKMDRNQTM